MNTVLSTAGLLFLLVVVPSTSRSQERLSIDEAVRIALEANPDVLHAQREVDAAKGRVLQAGRIPNPELTATWSEMPSILRPTDADEQDIGISQTIEFPTKRSRRIDVASVDKNVAELELMRTRTLVAARVKQAYHGLHLSTEIVTSLEAIIDVLKDFRQLTTARYEAGGAGYLDVVRAKVELARLQNELAEARRELIVRQSNLNLLLGRGGTIPIAISDSLPTPSLQPPDTQVSRFLETSSTLEIARQLVVRQNDFLSLAQTSYLPDFFVGVGYQRRAEEPPFNANEFSGITTISFAVELGVSIPLWFWQEPRGQVMEATALRDASEIRYRQTERSVRARISNALQTVRATADQLRRFDESLLTDAEDILRTGITQYQNNQIDILNLLDIYRTYRATKIEYARAHTNYLIALAELEVSGELPND